MLAPHPAPHVPCAAGEKGEGDLLNVVWVVDSAKLPFHRAEAYHQFHNGLGKVRCHSWWLPGRASIACAWLGTAMHVRTNSYSCPADCGVQVFPASYTRDLKQKAFQTGKIGNTGCPELPF